MERFMLFIFTLMCRRAMMLGGIPHRLGALIARGGNSRVYQAFDPNNRECAIKFCNLRQYTARISTPLPKMKRRSIQGRFSTFAHKVRVSPTGDQVLIQYFAATELDCSGILDEENIKVVNASTRVVTRVDEGDIHDIEGAVKPILVADGVLKMELMGPTLAESLDKCNPESLALLTQTLVKAARSAHKKGICFPDIKPDNICHVKKTPGNDCPIKWKLVDVDGPPPAGTGADEATYQTEGIGDNGTTQMLINIALTLSVACRYVTIDVLDEWFSHSNKTKGTFIHVKRMCPPPLQYYVDLISIGNTDIGAILNELEIVKW